MSLYDLAILGGGPAGLSAALTAGRARLRTAVVSAERPRNGASAASHGYLTRDGIAPRAFLDAALRDLHAYPSVVYLNQTASGARRDGDAVVIALADSSELHARRVILATGFADDLGRLGLPGLEAVYGRSVFPCPFCDGYEQRDRRLAVFGGGEAFASLVHVWSDDVVAFTNGAPLTADAHARMEARGVRVVSDVVACLHGADGQLEAVEIADGARVERDAGFLFIGDDFARPASLIDEALGVPRARNHWGIAVADADDAGRTAVAGVYVVGDARVGFGSVVEAAADGARCARAIVHEVAAERWRAGA